MNVQFSSGTEPLGEVAKHGCEHKRMHPENRVEICGMVSGKVISLYLEDGDTADSVSNLINRFLRIQVQ